MGLAGEHASWMFSKAQPYARDQAAATHEPGGITRRMVGELVASPGGTCPSRDRAVIRATTYRGAWQKTMPYGKRTTLCRRWWRKPMTLNDLLIGSFTPSSATFCY